MENKIYYSGAWRIPNYECLDCKKLMYIAPSRPRLRCVTCSRKKINKESYTSCTCSNCGCEFFRQRGLLNTNAKKSSRKSNRVFCNQSCSGSYNNKHKTHGCRRSKLEAFLEVILKENYPEIRIECNTTSAIGYELDFYFPDFNFAIEINGIFHYEPIFGETKLERIKYTDKQKILLCEQKNIELLVIPTLEGHLSKAVKSKYKQQIIKILDNVISRG